MEQLLENVHAAGRCCIAIHPSSQHLIIAGWNGLIKQYAYGLSSKSLTLSNPMDDSSQYHDDPIHEVAYCSSGDYFAICCEDGETVLFRHARCGVHSMQCKFDNPISSISFLLEPHAYLFAMSSDNGAIKLVNAIKCTESYFEFVCHKDGVRHIKFIGYKPVNGRSSEKYLAVAQCNGTFSIWKILKFSIFDQSKKEEDKVVKSKELFNVFPKIKGKDTNQRLDFDATQNGHLIAIPGNQNVKILDTKTMRFKPTESMSHHFDSNVCAFNRYLEKKESNHYLLASGDINGGICIWDIKYDDKQFGFEKVDTIKCQEGVCNLVWKSANELIVSSMNANIYKYHFETNTSNENVNTSNQTIVDKVSSMDIDNDKKEEENEQKIAEVATENKSDSDEDFDIDMDGEVDDNGKPSPTKKVLKRSFVDSDEEESPKATVQEQKSKKKVESEPKPKENTNEDKLQAELAAAAEMFGDDDAFDAGVNSKDEASPQSFSKKTNGMKIESFFEDEAEDERTMTKKEESMAMEEDKGEDLEDFIVADPDMDDADNDKSSTKKRKRSSMDDANEYGNGRNQMYAPAMATNHLSFMNGNTLYDEDGQRYLLFNQIGAVVARKQNVSSNPMEMNNIMSSLNVGKYSYEIDFFDKSKYARAVMIKSDHHFTCCSMNAFGILFGSEPSNDQNSEEDASQITDSIIRYKPISRNNEYRSFASEKDCEWNYVLPFGEIAVCVGLTNKYAIISTNKRFLRILSVGGLQAMPVISTPKNVINIAANMQNMAAIIFDDLSLWILDLNTKKTVYDGHCAVTNKDAQIIRAFMVNDKLITIDSEQIVRLLCNDTFTCGMQWIVILDICDYLDKKYGVKEKELTDMRPKGVWPVYFDAEEQCLMVSELKYLDYPIPSQSNGACILTDYKLEQPFLNRGKNEIDPVTEEPIIMFGNREESIMRQNVLHQFGDDKNESQHKKSLLKEYMRLFGHAAAKNKYVLAYDIAKHFLTTEKALSNAIKVAMHHQLPLLAEKLGVLAKEKMESSYQNVAKSVSVSKSALSSVSISPSDSSMNNRKQSVIKKPSRKLKRPSAKLMNGNNKKSMQNQQNNNNQNQLSGKKRVNNPCENDNNRSIQPPAKKRNPFSCNDGGKGGSNNYNDRKNNNSIFSL